MAGTLREEQCVFVTTSRSVIPEIRKISDRNFRENQNTHFMLNKLSPKIVPFIRQCEKYGRDGQTTDGNIKLRLRIA
jgi:hypothetical protein